MKLSKWALWLVLGPENVVTTICALSNWSIAKYPCVLPIFDFWYVPIAWEVRGPIQK